MPRAIWIMPAILMAFGASAAAQNPLPGRRAAPVIGVHAAGTESGTVASGVETSSEKKKSKSTKHGSEAKGKKHEAKKESKPSGEKHGTSASAPAAGPVVTPPQEALARLKEGNQRFRTGTPQHPHQDAARLAEMDEKGQHPFVTILCCSDSRVPPEILFDQGLGDVFAVRVAGNVADTDEIATMEYGIGHLHTPLLVVLGHEKCGAVTAVATSAELEGSLPELLNNIDPALAEARRLHPGLAGESLVPFVVRANVMQAIKDLLTGSPVARELVAGREVEIVGALYDLASGRVNWLGPHPEQATLVRSARRATESGRVAQH